MSQKNSLYRITNLLKSFNNGKKMTLEQISYENNVSERTARRDIKLLQEVFPETIIKSENYYTSIEKTLLNKVLSGMDLVTLITILNIFKSNNINFDIPKKLEEQLKNSKKIYNIINKPFEILKNTQLLKELEKSITFNQYITVYYTTSKKEMKIVLKPYKILLLNNNLYLTSEIDNKWKYSILRISLIKKVIIHSKTFYHKPKLLNFINNIQTPFANYKEGKEDIEVLIEVNKNIKKYFLMRKFFKSQKIIEELENENIIVSYKITTYIEIKKFLIEWLPNIKILSPTNLKKEITKDLELKLKSIQ